MKNNLIRLVLISAAMAGIAPSVALSSSRASLFNSQQSLSSSRFSSDRRAPRLLAKVAPSDVVSDEIEADNAAAPEAVLKSEASQLKSRVLGRVDFRPSWITKSGEVHTENMVEAGYKFTDDIAAYYQQNFNTNIYDPSTKATRGLNPTGQDGLVRVRFDNVWANEANGTYFNYEPRLYVPTNTVDRDAGMIVVLRNYFMLKQVVTPVVTFSAIEIPIVHFYDRAGFGSTANPLVENRIYLVTDIKLTKKLSFSFPIQFKNVRYRQYATGAKRNNTWGHKLWVWPELAYSVTPVVQVGAAYYSENLIASDFSDSAFHQGFEQGVAQMFLRAML